MWVISYIDVKKRNAIFRQIVIAIKKHNDNIKSSFLHLLSLVRWLNEIFGTQWSKNKAPIFCEPCLGFTYC